MFIRWEPIESFPPELLCLFWDSVDLGGRDVADGRQFKVNEVFIGHMDLAGMGRVNISWVEEQAKLCRWPLSGTRLGYTRDLMARDEQPIGFILSLLSFPSHLCPPPPSLRLDWHRLILNAAVHKELDEHCNL